MARWELHEFDCRVALPMLVEPKSIHTCVTSPPYFGLRDYEHPDQLGLEPTPEEFVAAMVAVFRLVRETLRDDGTLWLNLGDTYWSGRGASHGVDPKQGARRGYARPQDRKAPPGIKNKDLIGIPWMVAFALRADGWFLRQDIIWEKPNAMPDPTKDRCTRSHETIFMFSKSPRYYFDHEAIKEPAVSSHRSGNGFKRPERLSYKNADQTARGNEKQWSGVGGLRNKRSVWSVNTKPFKGAHFATYPAELVEPCILAGCPEGGTVLDPFGGAGTTALAANKHGRNAVLCEINPVSIDIIKRRLAL